VQDGPRAGLPSVSFLPRTLRAAFASRALPDGLRTRAGLPVGACVNDLRPEAVRPGFAVGNDRLLRLAFCELLAGAWQQLRDTRVLDRPWPASLDPRSVDWPLRVRRCLVSSGLIDDREWFAEVTYGRLSALTAIGTRSVFDFAVTAESAVDRAYNGYEAPPELVELARRAAESVWAGRVGGEDPRFRDLLGGDKQTLAVRLNAALGPEPYRAGDWFGLVRALPAVVERVDEIDRSPLDLAMREYVEALHGLDGASLEALLARLGLDGQSPRPLTVAAKGTGLSRERLRQLQTRLQARRPTHAVHMPALDRALELLVDAAPCPADEGAELLYQSGIATVSFRPESVLKAAELCGREAAFQLEQSPRGARIVIDPRPPYRGPLVRLAMLRATAFGAARLAELVQALGVQGIEVSDNRARDLLEHHAEAEFLDDDWLWLPNKSRSRLVTLTHRMLAAASPLQVETLRGGILRSYPRRDAVYLPPRTVLSALYEAHPEFSTDRQGRVRVAAHTPNGNALTNPERILLDVFEAAPRIVLDRASLRDACLAKGMNEHTFRRLMARTALLDSPAPNRWRLRGARAR
jgi:hypothetical protein